MNSLLRLIIVGLLTFSPASQSFASGRFYFSGAVPQAVNDSYATDEDVSLSVPVSGTPYSGVLSNDTDPENDLLQAELVTNVQHGTLVLIADGSFSYTPAVNWNGTDTFTYRANDGSGVSDTATVMIAVAPVNDVPAAAANTYAATEDTLLTVAAPGVLGNDTQVDTGETLTAVQDSYQGTGTLTLNSDGSFTYLPSHNFNGQDSFTYHAYDGANASNTVTVTLNVAAVNDPPEAVADQYAINEDGTMSISAANGVLGNDNDPENDPMTAATDSLPAHGTLTFISNGSFTYTPNANWYGTDGFTYHAISGGVNSNVVNVQLTVNSVNDIPVANNDTYPATEDVPLTVSAPGVLSNDTDVEHSTLSAYRDTQPAHGSVSMLTDGSFVYTPETNYNGPVSFTYHASDGTDSSLSATVSINITAVNDAPVATVDSYSTDEDVPLNIAAPGVLGNDSEVDGQAMTALANDLPDHGILDLDTNGHFTYSPDANWSGTDTFSYHASDGTLDSNIVTVSILVRPVNDIPTVVDDTYPATEDNPLTIAAPGVLSNDSDIEGSPLQAVLVAQPVHGSVVLNSDGSFTYTPEANYSGSVTFTYRANDGSNPSAIATVTLTLSPVNDPPVTVNDAYTTAEDTVLDVASLGIISNDQDVDNSLASLSAHVVQSTTHGTLTLNSNGAFHYLPAPNYNGTDTFTYYLTDSSDRSVGEATVTLTITAVNDAPVAVNDSYPATEDVQLSITLPSNGVLQNDQDVEGDPLRAVRVDGPSHGTLTLNENGTFLYTPAANYNGTDTFTYRASDGALQSPLPAATVTITIAAVNDAPVANAQSPTTPEDTGLNLILTASDVDGDPITYSIFTPPAHGTLTGTPPNVVYTPTLNYNGPDSFVFQVSDGTLTASNSVYLTITSVNDAPVGVGDAYIIDEDTSLALDLPGLLGNDYDVDNTSLTASAYVGPSHGTLTLHTNGSFTYSPVLNYNGLDSFSYRVSDGAALSAVTVVTITVNPINDAPTARGESYSATEDVALVITAPGLLLNDSDVDNDVLSVTISTPPAHGQITSAGNGSFTYTADPDYNGPDSFSYTVTDTYITTLPVTVSLTIVAVNDAPRTIPDDYRIGREGYLPIPAPGVLENDLDVEEDPITIKSYTQPTKGYLELKSDGSFKYYTSPSLIGSVSFTYVATDGKADAQPTTVVINLEPQSSAVSSWLSPIADRHSYRVGSEFVPLDTFLSIPPGFPCETEDITPCDPDLTYEIKDTYARYYRYDGSFNPPVPVEIGLVKGPDYEYNFDTSVLNGRSNEIDVAVTIEIVAKDSSGHQVGDSIFITSEKKYIVLYRLPWNNNNRLYFSFITK